MKCIKENCGLSYFSNNCGFCNVLDAFIFGVENNELKCSLPDKISQMEKELNHYKCALDKVIVYHAKNKKSEVN